MKRKTFLMILLASAPLGGCVPMMALSAANMVAQGTRKAPVSNEGMQTQARDACSAQAGRYGTVSIIDVEQHRINQIIVWGTVDDGKQKQSFECDFGTKITGFKLRDIRPEQ